MQKFRVRKITVSGGIWMFFSSSERCLREINQAALSSVHLSSRDQEEERTDKRPRNNSNTSVASGPGSSRRHLELLPVLNCRNEYNIE